MLDEVCVNADCPMCADYCPVADYPGVCRFEERGEAEDFPASKLMDLIKAEQEGRLVILPFPLGCTFRHNLDLRVPQEVQDYYELHHNLSVAIQAKRHGDGQCAFFPLDAFRVGNQLWENTMEQKGG